MGETNPASRRWSTAFAASRSASARAAPTPSSVTKVALAWAASFPAVLPSWSDVAVASSTSDQLGKTAGKDAAHAKATFVTLLGVGAARAEAERLAAQAVDHLRDAGLVSPILVELAHYIVTRSN